MRGGTLLTGPWQIVRQDADRCRAEIETVERGDDVPDQGYPVAVVYWGTTTEERLARLLTSAPELLGALKNLLPLAEKLLEASGAIDGLIPSRLNAECDIENARRAIEQAGGAS